MNYLDPILVPLINMDPNPHNPMLLIFLIGSLVSFIIVVLQKLLVDFDKMKEIQDEMKELQNDMRAAQKSGDPKALAKVQKRQAELLPKNKDLMMMQMKPSFITIIPILVIFYGLIGNSTISNMTIHISQGTYYLVLMPIWSMFYHFAPLTINWFGWYFIVTFAMSFLFRKLLGIKTM